MCKYNVKLKLLNILALAAMNAVRKLENSFQCYNHRQHISAALL